MAEMGLPEENGAGAADAAKIAALEQRVARLEWALAELSAEQARPGRLIGTRRLVGEPVGAAGLVAPAAGVFSEGQGVLAAAAAKPRASLESEFGTRVLSKVGVVLLLIGAAWFLKWAIDNRWIGPTGRVVAGLAAGAAIVVWSERFRGKGFAAFSYALKAVGTGVLYLSLWAGFQMYHLFPAGVALAAMLAVTVWNAVMALLQDAELLAGYALLGAYLTPALLSTGGNHEVFLFSYLLSIAAAVVVLLRVKPWSRLLLGALPVTVGYFIAWYAAHFDASREGVTLGFALLLWAAFAAVPLVARETDGVIAGVLAPLGAAMFGALSVYSALVDSGGKDWEPWAAVGFAAVYLGLMRMRRERVSSPVHLSLGVVFLTIAIPLKLTGRGITAGWLAEAVALLWVSALETVDRRAGQMLRWLACGSLLLGVAGALVEPWFLGSGPAFANREFATAMGAVAALALAMVLAGRMRDEGRLSGKAIGAGSLVLLNVVLLVAMHREIFAWLEAGRPGAGWAEAQAYSDFCFSGWMLLQGAVLLAAGFWRSVSLARWLGLVWLAATVVKAFAYDMRNLGTGYRVVSYLALGVVLMVVSFAYQKDWVGLKSAADAVGHDDEAAR